MKKTVLWILIVAVFIIAFNIVFFTAVNGEKTVSAWTSYGAIHLAYLMLVLSMSLGSNKKGKAVLNLSLGAVSVAYFIIEFLFGVIVIIFAPQKSTFVVTLQIILFSIYLIVFLTMLLANTHTAEAEEQHADDAAFIRESAARMKILVDQIAEDKSKRAVEQAYDAMRSSPAKTNYAVANIEQRISEQISILENAVNSQEKNQVIAAANTIVTTVNNRNQILKAKQ